MSVNLILYNHIAENNNRFGSGLINNFQLIRNIRLQGRDVNKEKNTPTGNASGPKVIKLFSCSTQLNMKFFMLINVKMPTIVGILTFMSGKNSLLGLSEPKKS